MPAADTSNNILTQYIDKVDHQDFLGNNPSHILYFWEIGNLHHITDVVVQALHSNVTIDGIRVPHVASSPNIKQQRSNDSKSVSTYVDMNLQLENSLKVVNSLTSIQVLLESKQHELEQVTNLLTHMNENKTNYEMELCTTDNEKKKSLLDKAVSQLESKILDLEKSDVLLKMEVSELQKQLQQNIAKSDTNLSNDVESISSGSTN